MNSEEQAGIVEYGRAGVALADRNLGVFEKFGIGGVIEADDRVGSGVPIAIDGPDMLGDLDAVTRDPLERRKTFGNGQTGRNAELQNGEIEIVADRCFLSYVR